MSRSIWDAVQTRRAIAIRSVKPNRFEGINSPWSHTGVPCKVELACGGSCCLLIGHVGDCECSGDDPGDPGSCFA